MTVAELRFALENIPGDLEVQVSDDGSFLDLSVVRISASELSPPMQEHFGCQFSKPVVLLKGSYL